MPLALPLALVFVVVLLGPVVPESSSPSTVTAPVILADLDVQPSHLAAAWQFVGIPYEQVIYALALGSSPQTLYAGTWGKGPYRSDDGGQTWQPSSDPDRTDKIRDLTKAKVRALAVTPGEETVYLGTWGRSIWFSQDRGATWQWQGKGIGYCDDDWQVYAVLIDQDEPNIVYQATWGAFYKSVDGGQGWELKDIAPDLDCDQEEIHDLIQARDGTLYAGIYGAGVYRSDDGGDTWAAMGPQKPAKARQVFSLAARDGVVWAGTMNGVYRTRDGGENWERVIAGFAPDARARRVQALSLDETGSLYAGTVDFGVYRSEDDGDTWLPYNEDLSGYALSILSLVYDERIKTLYATTYGGGIYRNEGDGWQPINEGLPASGFKVQSLAFAGPEQELLLAGTFVGGLYVSQDRGQSWKRWSQALPIGIARDVPDIVTLDGGQTLVVAGGTGIYRSTDGGETWQKAKVGQLDGNYRVLSLAQGRREPALLYAAVDEAPTVGVYHSTDGGETWEQIKTLDGLKDLAATNDGQTLYAIEFDRGPWRRDQEGNWQLLGDRTSRPPYGVQIVVDERTPWQQLILGFSRQSLHIRALDGIFSSFDGGAHWQPSLRGQFETLLADPERPGVLYATAMTDTVPAKVETDLVQAGTPLTLAITDTEGITSTVSLTDTEGITSTASLTGTEGITSTTVATGTLGITTVTLSKQRQYVFWVSLDDGRSWKQANFSNQPLMILTLDPLDNNKLLAGTQEGSVYYTTLDLPSPYTSWRAVKGLVLFVILPALVVGALLGFYVHVLLTIQTWIYPWQAWGLLFRYPAWRLVSTPNEKLKSLERLVALVVTGQRTPIPAETLWNELQNLGVMPTLADVQGALSGLLAHRLLTREEDGTYRFSLVALAHAAARHFNREALIDQVRSENLIARSAEAYFEQAGFQVVTLLDRLYLWPEMPHYRPLGWLNARFHIHEALDESGVETLAPNTAGGSPDLGFVVLDQIPTPDAYRALQATRLIPLSSGEIRRAVNQREAGLSLEQAIREGQGQEDLFDLRGPLQDHLAVFGREEVLHTWLEAIQPGEDLGFWGLPQSGRTSTLHWLQKKLPARRLSGYVDLRFRGPDWQPILRDTLAALMLDLRRVHSRLVALPKLDKVLATCGPQGQLEKGLDALIEQGLQRFRPHFVFFLDGAVQGAAVTRFRELARRRDDVSLVISWDGTPVDPSLVDGDRYLPPLTPAESHNLLQTLGARLGLRFDNTELDILDQAAGGHPLLLRLLGSQGARLAGRPDAERSHQMLRPGQWLDPLPIVPVSAQNAIQSTLERHALSLRNFWQALPLEVQRNLRLLTSDRSLDPALTAVYESLGLIARDEAGASQLRIGLLARWLQEERR